jgi:hypothetical protein
MRGHKVKERFPTHEISRGGIECAMATVQYRKLFPASSPPFFPDKMRQSKEVFILGLIKR